MLATERIYGAALSVSVKHIKFNCEDGYKAKLASLLFQDFDSIVLPTTWSQKLFSSPVFLITW
jgi:hypothetical protein